MHDEAGKGDSYRPVDRKRYENNFDLVFGTNCDVYRCGNPDLCSECQAEQDAVLEKLKGDEASKGKQNGR